MSRFLRYVAGSGALIALVLTLVAAGRAVTRSEADRTLMGEAVAVGEGTARMYVERARDGTPTALGISLTEGALDGLATHMNTTSRCWDRDGDGHTAHGECIGDYQATLAMPDGARELGLPFRWSTVNWNPEGHIEPAPSVWSWAHFDFHFFIAEPGLIESIRPGPCGEIIDCEDFERASRPLPSSHLPPGYVDVGAAVAGMGNHLVDAEDPEVADPSLGFSRTFIYGVYDGQLIFLEPMVSHRHLTSKPNDCRPVRTPEVYVEPGFYPTAQCVRYDEASRTYRVSLEGLIRR